MTGTNGGGRVIVVGGGIAGLTVAAFAARAGHEVTVFERASRLGGRALTHEHHGFRLNQGPHALYRSGAGMTVLRALGIDPQGGVPPASGGLAIAEGRLHALPGGPLSLLTTSLLGLAEKLEVARLLATVRHLDAEALDRIPVSAWARRVCRRARSRQTVDALVRLTTYVHAPARMSAGVGVRQIQQALGDGVLYLDHGWQQLVSALANAARAAGARIATGARAERLVHDGRVRAVIAADGTHHPAEAVVLAIPPADAARLADSATLARAVAGLTPVPAACLDVCLSALPRVGATFALGIDEPTYCSVHSAAGRLAPAGGAMIHVLRYLDPDAAGDAAAAERSLERVLDLVQPGWRDVLVHRRFLPRMAASHALPEAAGGGCAGRPPVVIPDVDGLLLAGDWVGPVGHLADASLASARRAAAAIDEGPGRRAT